MRIVSTRLNAAIYDDPAIRFLDGNGPRPHAPFDTVWNMLMAMDEQLAAHGLEIVTYRWNGSPHRYIWKIEARAVKRA